jgi:hypothetical protein
VLYAITSGITPASSVLSRKAVSLIDRIVHAVEVRSRSFSPSPYSFNTSLARH